MSGQHNNQLYNQLLMQQMIAAQRASMGFGHVAHTAQGRGVAGVHGLANRNFGALQMNAMVAQRQQLLLQQQQRANNTMTAGRSQDAKANGEPKAKGKRGRKRKRPLGEAPVAKPAKDLQAAAYIPESRMFNEMVQLEHHLDDLIETRKVEIADWIAAVPPARRRLRLWIWSSLHNQHKGSKSSGFVPPSSSAAKLEELGRGEATDNGSKKNVITDNKKEEEGRTMETTTITTKINDGRDEKKSNQSNPTDNNNNDDDDDSDIQEKKKKAADPSPTSASINNFDESSSLTSPLEDAPSWTLNIYARLVKPTMTGSASSSAEAQAQSRALAGLTKPMPVDPKMTHTHPMEEYNECDQVPLGALFKKISVRLEEGGETRGGKESSPTTEGHPPIRRNPPEDEVSWERKLAVGEHPSGFEIKRRGNKPMTAKLVLHLGDRPQRFLVKPPGLAKLLAVSEGTTCQIMDAVCAYIKTKKLMVPRSVALKEEEEKNKEKKKTDHDDEGKNSSTLRSKVEPPATRKSMAKGTTNNNNKNHENHDKNINNDRDEERDEDPVIMLDNTFKEACGGASEVIASANFLTLSDLSRELIRHCFDDPQPVEIEYNIEMGGPKAEQVLVWDIEVDVAQTVMSDSPLVKEVMQRLPPDVSSQLSSLQQQQQQQQQLGGVHATGATTTTTTTTTMASQRRRSELINTMAEHRRRRAVLLGFANAPVEFIHAMVLSSFGDVRVVSGGQGASSSQQATTGGLGGIMLGSQNSLLSGSLGAGSSLGGVGGGVGGGSGSGTEYHVGFRNDLFKEKWAEDAVLRYLHKKDSEARHAQAKAQQVAREQRKLR